MANRHSSSTLARTVPILAVSLLAAFAAGCDGDVDTDEEAICGPYDDQAQEAEVVMRIHNAGTDPIFLGGVFVSAGGALH